LKYAPTLITACCILHNLSIGTGDMGKDDELDNEPNSEHLEKIILTSLRIKVKIELKSKKRHYFENRLEKIMCLEKNCFLES
jgi:hypothetical protein